jgi:hypothetical protein
MLDHYKYVLTRFGAFLSPRTVYNLNASINYLEVGRWMRAKGYDTRRRFSRREELFDLVGKQVGNREVLYLEFGVFAPGFRIRFAVTRSGRSRQSPR